MRRPRRRFWAGAAWPETSGGEQNESGFTGLSAWGHTSRRMCQKSTAPRAAAAAEAHNEERLDMNRDTMQGNWKEMKGKAKERWGKLTDDDLDVVEGKADQLAGKIQQRYGKSKDEADREVDDFCRTCR
jgi:uncharacterized protein YjbJ (UPF0337 family)